MAATSVLSTDAEMNAMAGELVDTTGWTDANKTAWGIQAENYLSALVNYDLTANVASIGANFKLMLSEYVARYTAVSGIMYNMGTVGATFSSLIEPEDMVQFHIYRMERIEGLLRKGEVLATIGIT
jgi:hypothetical protein